MKSGKISYGSSAEPRSVARIRGLIAVRRAGRSAVTFPGPLGPADGFAHQFVGVGQPQFVLDARVVRLNRLRAEMQERGNAAGSPPSAGHGEHFQLAVTERFDGWRAAADRLGPGGSRYRSRNATWGCSGRRRGKCRRMFTTKHTLRRGSGRRRAPFDCAQGKLRERLAHAAPTRNRGKSRGERRG